MAERTPICCSIVPQCEPRSLNYCDPGPTEGFRLGFLTEETGWAGDWIETAEPVRTRAEARDLMAAADQAVTNLFRLLVSA